MMALSLIPVEEIKQKSMIDGKLDDSAQALHLMEWFHDSFFKWVNNPKCRSCSKDTTKCIEQTDCTLEERDLGGGRVEVYECGDCKDKTRFVRYNNPVTLLDTR
jgi:peptide-N4-(N-acetyl-beta-glucosaminyl)asparagine amidase